MNLCVLGRARPCASASGRSHPLLYLMGPCVVGQGVGVVAGLCGVVGGCSAAARATEALWGFVRVRELVNVRDGWCCLSCEFWFMTWFFCRATHPSNSPSFNLAHL